MSHTPTPWSASKIEYGDVVWIYGNVAPNKPRIAKVEFGINYGQDMPSETEANAAFIVRACNAHDELVAALKYCLLEHGGFTIKGDCERKARAALAKAEAQS